MRCLVNIYGIDCMVSEGRARWSGALNPGVPLIPAPRDSQESLLPWTESYGGGGEREANS